MLHKFFNRNKKIMATYDKKSRRCRVCSKRVYSLTPETKRINKKPNNSAKPLTFANPHSITHQVISIRLLQYLKSILCSPSTTAQMQETLVSCLDYYNRLWHLFSLIHFNHEIIICWISEQNTLHYVNCPTHKPLSLIPLPK